MSGTQTVKIMIFIEKDLKVLGVLLTQCDSKYSKNISDCVCRGHTSYITCIAISDVFVVTGSNDETVRKWEMSTCECLLVYSGKSDLIALENSATAMFYIYFTGRANLIFCAVGLR